MNKYIAYYRVSTDKQGIRGLGMESQKDIVENFVKNHHGEIVRSYIEVASGKKIDRVQLNLALKDCKRHKATLIVSKLDRLARNVHFITGLQEAGVSFVAVDFPQANELMIIIMAAVAQYERKLISERTKIALATAKKNGKKLGNPKLDEVRNPWNKTQSNKSFVFAKKIEPIISDLLKNNYSKNKIARELSRMGIKTPQGKEKWTPMQVIRTVKKLVFRNFSDGI